MCYTLSIEGVRQLEPQYFIKKSDAYSGFTQLREVLNDSIENPNKYAKSFMDMFVDVGTLAMEGNCIAQDLMAYYYKNGVKGYIPENFDLYMRWEILAGANGNEFAIEKLQFFLNYAFDTIADNPNLPQILLQNDIDEKNYVYVLGNLLCEGIVDDLQITTKKLIDDQNKESKYSPEKLRELNRALDRALPNVLDFLMMK